MWLGILIALPIGIISAYKQYSVFDQAGTFITMIGFSVPPVFLRRVGDCDLRRATGVVPFDL